MKAHHAAWLDAHPHRSEEWLLASDAPFAFWLGDVERDDRRQARWLFEVGLLPLKVPA